MLVVSVRMKLENLTQKQVIQNKGNSRYSTKLRRSKVRKVHIHTQSQTVSKCYKKYRLP